jgi:Tol biopolymer transport system component
MNTTGKIKQIIFCMLIAAGAVLLIDKDVNADFTFGTPMSLGPTVNALADNGNPHISPDGLALYFSSGRSGGSGGHDLYVSRRETPDAKWGMSMNLGPTVNSSADDWGPSLSPNGLELYFTSKRSGGHGGFSDIWLTTRATQEDDWGSPINLGPNINTSDFDGHPSISSDGLELYFCTSTTNERPGSGDSDIWVTSRLSLSDPWGPPVNLGSVVNSPYYDGEPDISADGLCLVLGSDRPGGSGGWDIWVTTRKKKEDPWGTPVNLGPEINSSNNETMADISYDGSMLYFASDQSGEYGVFDIWQVPIIPIVDINGDGIVDAADMCIIVDNWGTDNKLCDIGPMPWGDGIVDVEDLKILSEHLFVEVDDPTLVAHWPLDETEGVVVGDMVSENHAYTVGDPVWQPDGGQVSCLFCHMAPNLLMHHEFLSY